MATTYLCLSLENEVPTMLRLSRWVAFGLLLSVVAVQAQETTLKVKEGEAFPDIALPSTQLKTLLPDAKEISIKTFEGKKNVVVFFYPRAMTPGCTKESCGFTDIVAKFAETNTVVFGASNDKLDAQEKFTEKEKLKIPLLADSENKLLKALGIENAKGTAAQRVTFVINKEGKIAKIYTKVDPAKHPEEVLSFVKGLK
jgi:peroxiredoxin Q/BCP